MVPRTAANFTLAELAGALLATREDGTERARLRSKVARALEVDDVALVPSGRAGLYAILAAAPEITRVVVPAYTCNAVTEAAKLAGKPVAYVDIEPGGFNVAPEAVARVVKKGDAYVATHQFGFPCDIEATVDVCRERGVFVIEDAAASLGTRVSGKLTGTFGDAGFYSFDIGKLVTVPLKGGAVVARDPAFLARVRAANDDATAPMPPAVKARLLGLAGVLVGVRGPRRYRAFHTVQFRGGKFTAETGEIASERGLFYRWRMADWQAAIAARQIDRLDALVARRRALYRAYRDALAGVRHIALPPEDAGGEWAPIRFPIRVRTSDARGGKLAFYREAARRGVDMAFSFTFLVAPKEHTNAHALADAVLDIPFYDGLTDRERDAIVATLLTLDQERVAC